MPANIGTSWNPTSTGSTKYSQNSWTTSDVPRKTSTYTRATARTGHRDESSARPATSESTTVSAIPPSAASAVATRPSRIDETMCDTFDTTHVPLRRAEFLGRHVRLRQVRLREAEG